MDWSSIVVAVIGALGAFLGVYFSNKKQTALMAYRLEVLEKKVDNHNHVAEKMIRIEKKIEDMEKAIERIGA